MIIMFSTKVIELRHDDTRWRAFILSESRATGRTITKASGTITEGVPKFLRQFGLRELVRMARRETFEHNVSLDGWRPKLATWRTRCAKDGLLASTMGRFDA